jgi:hypothetical protein
MTGVKRNNKEGEPSKSTETTMLSSKQSKMRIVVRKQRKQNRKLLAVARNNRHAVISNRGRNSDVVGKEGIPRTGLPIFQQKHQQQLDNEQHDEDQDDDDDDNDVDVDDDIPSDTLVAFRSIIQSDQGLPLPVTTGHDSIQAVLEHQIYSTFYENHASTIQQELQQLIRKNSIRQLHCPGHDDRGGSNNNRAFVRTDGYIQAVWDAYYCKQNSTTAKEVVSLDMGRSIVTWFVQNLQHWVGRTVSRSSLETCWDEWTKNECRTDIAVREGGFEPTVKYLMDLQLLIRDMTLTGGVECYYYLWLPQWGVVLKSWNDAKKQLLNVLARTKEISKMNLCRRNRHPCISTQFLLNELVHQGRVEVIERPFGSFVRLVQDKT